MRGTMPACRAPLTRWRGKSFAWWMALAVNTLPGMTASADPVATRHFAANHNFDASGNFTPGAAGFDLADISKPDELVLLPDGVQALVWIGRCEGATDEFKRAVAAFAGSPKIFGFYLMDDPDPTGRYARRCTAEGLRSESDWIHSVTPGARTFVMLMNMGTSRRPAFDGVYRPENSHLDLFGISPYPCRSELGGCDFGMIASYVAAAEAAGIPRTRMVPTYQTFGGGKWRDDGGGRYQLPTVPHAHELLAHWGRLLQTPVFDYAYSWGRQRDDDALENAPELRRLMSIHNTRARPGMTVIEQGP